MKKILYPVEHTTRGNPENYPDFLFFCPGCKCAHGFWTTKKNSQSACWTFDGDMDCPTFTPSLLISGTVPITDSEADRIMAGEKFKPVPHICHTNITMGQIVFHGDCTHKLAGKTVPMVAY